MTVTIIISILILFSTAFTVFLYIQFARLKKKYMKMHQEYEAFYDQVANEKNIIQIDFFRQEKEIRELKKELGKEHRLSSQK